MHRVVYLTQFLNGVSSGLVYPIAAYYAQSFGARPAVITLVLSMHALARLALGPAWGRAADTYGRRPVLLAGIGLTVLGHLVFALAPSVFFLGLGRLVAGAGTGDGVAAAALVADTSSPADRTQRIGGLRAAYGVGLLLGPVLGGGLGMAGLSVPAFVAAGLSLVNLAYAAATLKEPARRLTEVRAPIAWNAGIVALLIVACAASLAVGLVESVVPLIISQVLVPQIDFVSWRPERIAIALTVGLLMGWGICVAVVEGWLAGKLARKFGDRPILFLALLGWTAAFAVTPWVFQQGLVACAAILFATAFAAGLTATCAGSLLSRSAGRGSQGQAFGAAQSSMAVGEFAGPAVSGWLFEWMWALPYYAASAALGLAWVAWTAVGRRGRSA